MSSGLRTTLNNIYTANLENKIFNPAKNPSIDRIYVDDIFMLVKKVDEIHEQQENLKKKESILNFAYGLNVINKIPFLMYG